MRCVIAVAVFALLAVSAFAEQFTINVQVGSRSGSPFVLEGAERITGVRMWDRGSYISGLQLRYGVIWTKRAGFASGTLQELNLFEGEVINQVSGRWSHYIQSLMFVTNKGRSLMAGQWSGNSFNMYAESVTSELRSITGTYHGALTGFAAHFGGVYQSYDDQEH